MTLSEKYKVEPDKSINTGLVKQWNKAIKKEISDLDVHDVSMLITQKHFLEDVIPIAISFIKADPLCGYYYKGELLEGLSNLGSEMIPFKNELKSMVDSISQNIDSLEFEFDSYKEEFRQYLSKIKEQIN